MNDINTFFTNVYSSKNFHFILENHKVLKYHWSRYNLQFPVFRKILESNIVNDEQYILCIFYKDNYNNVDIQFGSSETAKYTETYIKTLSRCLGEELGLNIIGQNIDNYNFHNFTFKNKNINLWAINIENLNKNSQIQNENISPDNRNNKTYCIIYGNEKNILEYMNSEVKLDKSEDNIKGIIAIKLKDLKIILY